MKNIVLLLTALLSTLCAEAQSTYFHLTDAQRDSMTAPIIKNSKYIFEVIYDNFEIVNDDYVIGNYRISQVYKGSKDIDTGIIKMLEKNKFTNYSSHHSCITMFTGVSYIFFVNEVPQAKLKELNIKPDTTYPNQKIVQFTNPCFQPFREKDKNGIYPKDNPYSWVEWGGGYSMGFASKNDFLTYLAKYTKLDNFKKKENFVPKNQNKLSSSVMSNNPLLSV